MHPSRRFLKLTVVFGILHGTVFLGTFLTAFSRTMYRFDHPEVTETLLDKVCGSISSVLIEPYLVVSGDAGLHSRFLDMAGMILNSLLWGAAFSLLFVLLKRPQSSVQSTVQC
jgi:hypothetical protein